MAVSHTDQRAFQLADPLPHLMPQPVGNRWCCNPDVLNERNMRSHEVRLEQSLVRGRSDWIFRTSRQAAAVLVVSVENRVM